MANIQINGKFIDIRQLGRFLLIEGRPTTKEALDQIIDSCVDYPKIDYSKGHLQIKTMLDAFDTIMDDGNFEVYNAMAKFAVNVLEYSENTIVTFLAMYAARGDFTNNHLRFNALILEFAKELKNKNLKMSSSFLISFLKKYISYKEVEVGSLERHKLEAIGLIAKLLASINCYNMESEYPELVLLLKGNLL